MARNLGRYYYTVMAVAEGGAQGAYASSMELKNYLPVAKLTETRLAGNAECGPATIEPFRLVQNIGGVDVDRQLTFGIPPRGAFSRPYEFDVSSFVSGPNDGCRREYSLEFVDGVYTDRITVDPALGVLSVTAESDTLIDEKQVVIIVRTLDDANNLATAEQRTESLTISTGCVAGSTSLSAPTMNRMVMRKGSNTAMDVIASFQTGNNLCPVTSYELLASDDVAPAFTIQVMPG